MFWNYLMINFGNLFLILGISFYDPFLKILNIFLIFFEEIYTERILRLWKKNGLKIDNVQNFKISDARNFGLYPKCGNYVAMGCYGCKQRFGFRVTLLIGLGIYVIFTKNSLGKYCIFILPVKPAFISHVTWLMQLFCKWKYFQISRMKLISEFFALIVLSLF